MIKYMASAASILAVESRMHEHKSEESLQQLTCRHLEAPTTVCAAASGSRQATAVLR